MSQGAYSSGDKLKEEMERRYSILEAVKVAYFNGTPFHDKVPDYSDVRKAAEEFIAANYALQKAQFGRVQVKLSVSALLRDL